MGERVALVTGSSQGIGMAIALRLAADGFRIVVNGLPGDEKGPSVAEEIRSRGLEAIFISADVSNPEDVKAMFKRISEKFGRLDVLVNNAGIARDNLLMRVSDEEWAQSLNVNLSGAFFCIRSAVRLMIKNSWGRIISLSSIIGIHGNAGQASYAASKAGIIGLTKSVAREYGSRGITANAVAPGYIDTAMTAGFSDEMRQALVVQIPLGRTGTPEDVAGVVSFLASPDAAYVSGQVIPVDGGLK
jgi:3-oxoacyl-[acyl-carrier protein] reductase